MSSTVNSVLLVGHLGADPDLRYVGDGEPRARLRLATDRPVRSGGQRITDWHTVVCRGSVAEFANEYLRKGRLVCVTGRLSYYTASGPEGDSRRVATVVAKDIIPLDPRPSEHERIEREHDVASVPVRSRPAA